MMMMDRSRNCNNNQKNLAMIDLVVNNLTTVSRVDLQLHKISLDPDTT
jgi:hypothetical protein